VYFGIQKEILPMVTSSIPFSNLGSGGMLTVVWWWRETIGPKKEKNASVCLFINKQLNAFLFII